MPDLARSTEAQGGARAGSNQARLVGKRCARALGDWRSLSWKLGRGLIEGIWLEAGEGGEAQGDDHMGAAADFHSHAVADVTECGRGRESRDDSGLPGSVTLGRWTPLWLGRWLETALVEH